MIALLLTSLNGADETRDGGLKLLDNRLEIADDLAHSLQLAAGQRESEGGDGGDDDLGSASDGGLDGLEAGLNLRNFVLAEALDAHDRS